MASKRTKRVIIILVVVGMVAGLWATAFLVSGITGAFTGGYARGGADYREVVLEDGDSLDKVVMIHVAGEIFSDPQGNSFGASDSNIIDQIDRALDDRNLAAIILSIDTPGGGVVASDAIHNKVREAAEEVPVIALMGDTAASGGYYISAAASEIVAHRYTWTGSIGVIAMIPNLAEAADKIGVQLTVLKSGPLKDAGSILRDLTEEEQQLFQVLIDEAYDGFVQVIVEGRDLPEERVRELGDGRIYSGIQAEQLGLVDRLGDRSVAFERARELSGAEDASLVAYQPVIGLFDNIPFFFSLSNPVESIKQDLGIPRSPGPAYLWIP